MATATREHDLTKGSLYKQILLFSLPLIASNLLQVLFNMSDIAVVGRFSGSVALGAVGSTTTLVSLFTGFLIGLGSGINVVTARHIGARDAEGTRQTVATAALVSLLIGIALCGIGLAGTRGVLRLLGTKPELMEGAALYLHIYFLGMPAMALYNYGNAVFSAAGDTRRPLLFLLFAGIVNVLLNLFFVIVCSMSVAGVALATIISQYLSAGLILLALARSKEVYTLRLQKGMLRREPAGRVLALGLPAGFQNTIFAIANLFIQAGVNRFDAVMVEGNSAAANADAMIYDVMAAFYVACSSFMGQNLGAGDGRRVKKSFRISLLYSFVVGTLMGVLLLLFGRTFLSLFTTEQAVIDAGMKRLQIMGLSYGVSAFMDCAIAGSRGLGKSLVPTIIVIMGSCVFRLVWVYTVFAYFGTIPSLYLLYVFSWSITAVAELLYYRHSLKTALAQLATATV